MCKLLYQSVPLFNEQVQNNDSRCKPMAVNDDTLCNATKRSLTGVGTLPFPVRL